MACGASRACRRAAVKNCSMNTRVENKPRAKASLALILRKNTPGSNWAPQKHR
ncbi:hypothetical protein IG631_12965 [Alternaria alternata]|nr:hypothetical protein IG631_12965 [Alternaria alternata]